MNELVLDEQTEAEMKQIADKWIQLALRNDPLVKSEVVASVCELYRTGDLQQPFTLTFLSPYQALACRYVLLNMTKKVKKHLKRYAPKGEETDKLLKIVDACHPDYKGDDSPVPLTHLSDEVKAAFDNSWKHVFNTEVVDKKKDAEIYDWVWTAGAFDGFWLSFYEFAVKHLRHKLDDTTVACIEAYSNYAKTCGVAFFYEGIAFVCERPAKIKLDEDNRLHCEEGKALEYPDGTGCSMWHGESVPDEWLDGTKPLTAKDAIRQENLELRRIAMQIVGWDRIADELGAKVIHKDENPEIGELVQINIPDVGKELLLRVRCGTGRPFAIPVPPDMKTARQANAWTYDLDENEYVPEVRT